MSAGVLTSSGGVVPLAARRGTFPFWDRAVVNVKGGPCWHMRLGSTLALMQVGKMLDEDPFGCVLVVITFSASL